MGAATQAVISGLPRKIVSGTTKTYTRLITMSNSYAANGDVLNLKTSLGVNKILNVHFDNAGGYVLSYDVANGKIKAYEAGADGAALDEVTATTDLSAVAQRATIIAK